MTARSIGEAIRFGRRAGTIIGHTVVTRDGEPQAFYVVELDRASAAYLEHDGAPDCFISLLLVNVDSYDAEEEA